MTTTYPDWFRRAITKTHPILNMTSYTVQYVLPVDNPVNKVSVVRRKGHMTFEVPLNYPDAHNLNLAELIAAAERSGLLTVSPTLNKKKIDCTKGKQ